MAFKPCEDLKKMADPAIQIWVWVASFLGSLAQEGEIPPMASPIYGRLLQIVKSAQDAMKQIRAVRATALDSSFFFYG